MRTLGVDAHGHVRSRECIASLLSRSTFPQMGEPATVVIVDDSEEMRDALEMTFQMEGYRVLAFADAGAAFEAIRREHPDVVITDVLLGLSNGLDLITRIRSDLPPPVPPIIAISGFTSFE